VPDCAGRPHTAALQEVMLSAQRAATMPHATMQMTSWQKNTISSSLHAHRAAVTHAHDACTHSQLHVPAHASQRRACARPERARSRPCTSIHADCHHLQRVWPGHDDSCGCVETARGACLDPGPTRKEDHHNLLLQSGAVAPDIPREGSRATQHGGCMGTGLAGAPETMGGNRLGVCGHGLRRPPRPTVSACRLTGGYVVVAHRVGGHHAQGKGTADCRVGSRVGGCFGQGDEAWSGGCVGTARAVAFSLHIHEASTHHADQPGVGEHPCWDARCGGGGAWTQCHAVPC